MRLLSLVVVSLFFLQTTAESPVTTVAPPVGPAPTYAVPCTGCQVIDAATASRDGSVAVVAGGEAFGLFTTATGAFKWILNYVDYGSEQEGPFAFDAHGTIAGLAPNSGTIETVWGINATNGNNTWSQSDDGSMSQLSLAATPNSFVSGSVTDNAVARMDSRTGNVTWKVQLNDYIFNMATSARNTQDLGQHPHRTGATAGFVVYVAYGVVAAAFDEAKGTLIWNVTELPTQLFALVVDEASRVVMFAGCTDPSGNPLTYCTVYGFDASSGKRLWEGNFTSSGSLVNVVAAADGVSYLFTASSVIAVSSRTGKQLWTMPAFKAAGNNVPAASPGRAVNPITKKDEAVLFFSASGSDLTCVGAKDGAVRWVSMLPAGHVATQSPIVTRTLVILPTAVGGEHAFVVAFPTGH